MKVLAQFYVDESKKHISADGFVHNSAKKTGATVTNVCGMTNFVDVTVFRIILYRYLPYNHPHEGRGGILLKTAIVVSQATLARVILYHITPLHLERKSILHNLALL